MDFISVPTEMAGVSHGHGTAGTWHSVSRLPAPSTDVCMLSGTVPSYVVSEAAQVRHRVLSTALLSALLSPPPSSDFPSVVPSLLPVSLVGSREVGTYSLTVFLSPARNSSSHWFCEPICKTNTHHGTYRPAVQRHGRSSGYSGNAIDSPGCRCVSVRKGCPGSI